MKVIRIVTAVALLSGSQCFADSLAQAQDHMLGQAEKEVVSLAKAMPADKYNFAPTKGAFEGVRTFGQQMSHIAAVLDEFAAVIQGEKAPETGEHENGPATLKSKDDIVKYLEDAFAHSHKAMLSLKEATYTQQVTMPWGKTTRATLAIESVSHSMDHYGQAVIYARMNNVVPPASRK